MATIEERKVELKSHSDLAKLKEGEHYYVVKIAGFNHFINAIQQADPKKDFDIKIDFSIKHLYFYLGIEEDLNADIGKNSKSVVFHSVASNKHIKINLINLAEYGIFEIEENKEKIEEAALFLSSEEKECLAQDEAKQIDAATNDLLREITNTTGTISYEQRSTK